MTIGKEEVLRSTNSVMNLYTKLAQLEKEGKRGTKEYCDIFSLLEWSIRSEKNKYKNTSFSDKDKETYLKKLLLKKSNQYFIYPTADNLILIRTLNYMSNNCQFTLDGVIPNSSVAVAVADFQRNIDFIFLKQIMICLSQESLTESERDSLIDFKYGLIATSSKLEDHFLSQELNLPKTNSELSNFELNISSNYAVKKVMELTEYLTLLIDDNIDEQTLPIALYLKSCIPVLPPLFVGGTLHELQNCISLLQQFEGCSGESRKKVCKLLSYIIGDTCQLENIEEESKQKLIELPEIMK